MQEYYATVGPEGEIEIPEELRASVGIAGEASVALWIEGGRLLLELVRETRSDRHFSA
jgi:hypothetical protein